LFLAHGVFELRQKEKTVQRVKGVRDITPDAIAAWLRVENVSRDIFARYHYREMRTPIFEKTEVFARSIGETSDIVEKEMYTFADRGGESLTLRPEGTAPVVRAFVENGLFNLPGVQKIFYLGPMFRAERPQAGRFRQFHQVGAEAFGSDDPALDAEQVAMLMDLFAALGLPGLAVRINSLGCPACRPAYGAALQTYLLGRKDELCADCRRRVARNPMRALDCKSKTCATVVAGAPSIGEFLCAACREHMAAVLRLLNVAGVRYTVDPGLVRGLDYYTRTAFEVISGRLGAQNAVAGGGRYDNLVEQFGGPATPAIGFALGVERLISLLDGEKTSGAPDVFVVPVQPEAEEAVFGLAASLRAAGLRVDRGFGGASLKSQMKKADKSGARFTVIVGEDELARAAATLRDLERSEQKEVSFDKLAVEIKSAILNS